VVSVARLTLALQVRHLLQKFADIGRVYLTPEDPAVTRRRRKLGGNKRIKYEDGWVEFMDKRKARQVAAMLNGQPIGSKNRGFYEHDLWTIK
jgi:ESF2/ABP1 family protein